MNIKRSFDITASFTVLVILSPLLLPIIFLLKLTGEREVFYFQERVGKDGQYISVFKFATMLKNSENMGSGIYTSKNDERVLPLGRFLRKTKINELPQILNVLKGDMSVVGPRPLIKRTFDLYSEEVKSEILTLKPGLTGIGSIVFRDEESILAKSDIPLEEFYKRNISPYKGKLEIWYKNNQSFSVDIIIIFLTIWIIIFPSKNITNFFLKGLPTSEDI